MLHQRPTICLQAGDGAADVLVDLDDLLYRARLQQCARHSFLHAQDDAFARLDADRGGAEFDGFEGVLDLKEAAFGRESAVGFVSR